MVKTATAMTKVKAKQQKIPRMPRMGRASPRGGARGLENLRPGKLLALPEPLNGAFFGDHFRRYGVHDDGSCFFHTVCCALNTSNCQNKSGSSRQRIGHQFRRMIQHKLTEENWATVWSKRKVRDKGLLPNVAKVRSMLGNTKTWADVYMIFLTMDMSDLNLIFFDAASDQVYCGVRGLNAANQRTLLVLWINHAHFEPIVRLDGDEKPTFLFNTEDPFVSNLMQKYHKDLCPGKNDDIHNVL